MITDPISDMLTRVRNALAVRRTEVSLPYSNIKFAIAKILEKEGYVSKVAKEGDGPHASLKLTLAYQDREPRIRNVRRVSKPGKRVYAKADEYKSVMSGLGIAIVSTPNGLMTNREARARRLGGEVICEVY